jgi:molecular chaperone Hsp33
MFKMMLGEMMSAAALLSANLKFNGSIIMQIHGDGPVQLLVVECDASLKLRATAKLAEDAHVADDAKLQHLINAQGQGRFAITLDPADKLPGQQAYQGIVALDGDSIATIIENYMLRSEQLDTRLWLAADEHTARGLLLQKLPTEGGIQASAINDADTWDRTVMLASTGNPRRNAHHRHHDAVAAPLLGRDCARIRATSSAISLHVHA